MADDLKIALHQRKTPQNVDNHKQKIPKHRQREREKTVPLPMSNRIESERARDGGVRERVRRVLFVGKDEQNGVGQLLFLIGGWRSTVRLQQRRRHVVSYLHHRHQLLFGDRQALGVGAVDHIDDGVGVAIITSPVRPNRRLAAEIPH